MDLSNWLQIGPGLVLGICDNYVVAVVVVVILLLDSGEFSHYITFVMIGSSMCWMQVEYYDMMVFLARLVGSCLFVFCLYAYMIVGLVIRIELAMSQTVPGWDDSNIGTGRELKRLNIVMHSYIMVFVIFLGTH